MPHRRAKIGIGALGLMVAALFVGACSDDPEVTWVAIITGNVVGDVTTDVEVSSIGVMYFCASGATTRETFSARVRADGTFRAFASDNNTGPDPRCFDLLVARSGLPIDTIEEVGPLNFHSRSALDSMFLQIRVFQNDSATIEQIVTLPQGASF